MSNSERKEKEQLLEYYYELRHRINEPEIHYLNKMIKQLKEELKGNK